MAVQDEGLSTPGTAGSRSVAGFPPLLAAEVRSRRIQLSLNQADVADLAGVSERFVRFVEQGKPTVQLEPLLAVLHTLGLELTVRTAPSESEQP
jgi:y4mF family transcriptional regulator